MVSSEEGISLLFATHHSLFATLATSLFLGGTMSQYDVIVVGAGNAAFCAALAAQEEGASVLMLEAAPQDESGGNSRFTAGSIRVVYNGVDDIKTLVPDLTEAEIATTDFGAHTQEQFFVDIARGN